MTTDADITIGPATSLGTSSASGIFSSGSTPLPADILERARARVRVAAFSIAALWVFVLVMNEGVRRILPKTPGAPTWDSAESAFALVGLVLALGVASYVNRCEGNPGRAIDIGLGLSSLQRSS